MTDLGPWTSGTLREIGEGRVVRVRDTQPVDIDVLGGYGSGRCKGTASEQWGKPGTGDRGPGTDAYGLDIPERPRSIEGHARQHS